jgi:amidohydrolase
MIEKHPMHNWLSETRRYFHMHPEISCSEHNTTRRIKEMLLSWGLEPIELPGLETGTCVLIKGSQPGKTLAIRADIDALPLQEMNEVPYRSTAENCMHACGHDGHTTILLGVAKTVVEENLARDMKGNLLLIFQPSEEKVSGAANMIEAGVLEVSFPDRILALHVAPQHPAGYVGFCEKANHASAERLSINIRGTGSHGAHPENGRDPILAAAHFVTALQGIVSRAIGALDSAVVTVGSLHAGTVGNIIPETAQMEGTIRTYDPEIRKTVQKRMDEIRRGIETLCGVEIKIETLGYMPALIGDPETAHWFKGLAEKVVGPENAKWQRPSMGAEDFALFAQKVPATLMFLGSSKPGQTDAPMLHSPFFDLDEDCLGVGLDIFLRAIKDYLI